MRVRVLNISLQDRHVGELFQYGEGRTAITRFLPAEEFWRDRSAPILSWSTNLPESQREAFWTTYDVGPFFNGPGTSLPPFFQNMLPEGALRRHLAHERGCAIDDHFEIFAACGTDLPGAVYAHPADVDREKIARIVTQDNDALEVSVLQDPIAEATSLSGLQPKLSLVEKGGRYVARTKDVRGIHIIAKLAAAEYPLLPEVEELSLRLAAVAGVTTCAAKLAPMSTIDTDVPFAMGEERTFLAVERFDRRDGFAHIHCEDFAQILMVQPEMKYQDPDVSYALMASVLMEMAGGGSDEPARELVRRLAVNEMLGNYDAHIKNFGVIYPDGRTPMLSPAYDVVAYAAYLHGRGHALRFARGAESRARLTPATLRAFCNECGMSETVAAGVVREATKAALGLWPDMISDSALLPNQKDMLLDHFYGVPSVAGLVKRRSRAKPAAA